MKQYWQRFAAKIDSRNQRERTLIFIMAIVVSLALVNTALFDPLRAKAKRLSQEAAQQREQLADLGAKIQAARQTGKIDPDAPLRVRLAAVKQGLEQAAIELKGTQESLVPPDRMARLLEDMLSQNHNLKLVSLSTLPVSGVLEKPEEKGEKAKTSGPVPTQKAKAESETAPAIYKHGVEITVAGSYADLAQYLAALEKLPWHMYWGKAEMHVEEYPRVVLKVTLYTLSMEQTWLSV